MFSACTSAAMCKVKVARNNRAGLGAVFFCYVLWVLLFFHCKRIVIVM